ncbi:hypothetical protein [Actinosynnema sp. NPDC020468]|uniref:hypothetical protein n=1 Tax=Actinosynnema sp. NPDC020468 TaxID=3154488 RepID=UPI0033F398D9
MEPGSQAEDVAASSRATPAAGGERFGGARGLTAMTYDIAAFEPADTDDDGWESWYGDQHDYFDAHPDADASVTSPRLRAFHEELARTVTAATRPEDGDTSEEFDELGDTDPMEAIFTFSPRVVYGEHSHGQEKQAIELWLALAEKHGLAVALLGECNLPIHRF